MVLETCIDRGKKILSYYSNDKGADKDTISRVNNIKKEYEPFFVVKTKWPGNMQKGQEYTAKLNSNSNKEEKIKVLEVDKNSRIMFAKFQDPLANMANFIQTHILTVLEESYKKRYEQSYKQCEERTECKENVSFLRGRYLSEGRANIRENPGFTKYVCPEIKTFDKQSERRSKQLKETYVEYIETKREEARNRDYKTEL